MHESLSLLLLLSYDRYEITENSSILLSISFDSLSFHIFLADSKGYLVDEDGFDFMKISFLRDIKAQHRSLRFVLFL